MRMLDFAPLPRSTIGFDRLFELLDQTGRSESAPNWPPYNVERVSDDEYRITMALAGFPPEEIEVVATPNLLTVSGQKAKGEEGIRYLYHGIATRGFKRTFELADYVKVADAKLENGLLVIELVREVPEALKPRRIEVKTGQAVGQDNQVQHIEHAEAA